MKVTAIRTLYVDTKEGKALLTEGDSHDVDGRVYSSEHPFVKGGYLVAEAEEKPKRKAKASTVDKEPEDSGSADSSEPGEDNPS